MSVSITRCSEDVWDTPIDEFYLISSTRDDGDPLDAVLTNSGEIDVRDVEHLQAGFDQGIRICGGNRTKAPVELILPGVETMLESRAQRLLHGD